MQILLANAKIMFEKAQKEPSSMPIFQHIAEQLAEEMARHNVLELAKELDCNAKIASENLMRYQNFAAATPMPAIMAYNGQAYKHLQANSLTDTALTYAQTHLWIASFLYGLLRPMDAIVPYRMEHCVALNYTQERPLNQFWRDKLTDVLLRSVKSDDGIVLHLSTEEYEHLFDWNKVRGSVRVVQPLFYVEEGRKLKVQAVWAKTCRGAMTRYILENQIDNPENLMNFSYEGFVFAPDYSTEDKLIFCRR